MVPPDSSGSPGPGRASRTHRAVLLGALACWAAAVAVVTLRPADDLDDELGVVRDVCAWLVAHGVPLSFEVAEAVANVVMFVPLGVLLTLLVGDATTRIPRPPRRARVRVILLSAGVGLVLSSAIELGQRTWLPSRVPTVQDVVMNTLGALVGALAVVLLDARRRARPHPRRRRRRAGSPAGEPARHRDVRPEVRSRARP